MALLGSIIAIFTTVKQDGGVTGRVKRKLRQVQKLDRPGLIDTVAGPTWVDALGAAIINGELVDIARSFVRFSRSWLVVTAPLGTMIMQSHPEAELTAIEIRAPLKLHDADLHPDYESAEPETGSGIMSPEMRVALMTDDQVLDAIVWDFLFPAAMEQMRETNLHPYQQHDFKLNLRFENRCVLCGVLSIHQPGAVTIYGVPTA